MKTIELLRQYAREADSIHQGCAESNRAASITGAIGGGFGTALGGLTIATGGLAAPMLLGGLALCGTVCSVGGGVWCIKNEHDKRGLYENLEKEIVQLLREDDNEVKKMESIFRTLDGGHFGESRKFVFRASSASLAALGGVAMIHGFWKAQKAGEKVFEEATENPDGTTLSGFRKYGGNFVWQVGGKAVEKASAKAAKATAAKVTGTATLVFGIAMFMWEGYNVFQNHCEVEKESQLGKELRELANLMEEDLNKIRCEESLQNSSFARV